jgi:Nucleoside-diphosphate-sugar epimerases
VKTLILGGTAWLGRTIAKDAHERGHDVTCLARGESGAVADGVTLVAADRLATGAYEKVRNTDWDFVVEVSWQPGMVRSALAALADRAGHWAYVSSCSAYAAQNVPGATESAATLPPLESETADRAEYGAAKVACERLTQEIFGSNALIARAGLIGGYGDPSDRFGYWPARFSAAARGTGGWRLNEPVLVPDDPAMATQTIDVRDLAEWLVRCGESGTGGVFNATGQLLPFATIEDACREVTGAAAEAIRIPPQWLRAQGVEEFAGERSLPLWIIDPDAAGHNSRDTTAAVAAGLTWRPIQELVRSALAWETERGLRRQRRAGLTPEQERQLIGAWRRAPKP